MVFPRRGKGLKEEVEETCTVVDFNDDPLPAHTAAPPPAAEPEPPKRKAYVQPNSVVVEVEGGSLTAAEKIKSDRACLLALWRATGAPVKGKKTPWRESYGWGTKAPLRQWHGVTVNGETGRVIGLNLAGNGLAGAIPAPLGDLDRLRELDLSRNSLVGDVPASLTKLHKLELLNLSMNHLSSVPDVTEMPALRKAFLTDNAVGTTTTVFSNHRENIETDQVRVRSSWRAPARAPPPPLTTLACSCTGCARRHRASPEVARRPGAQPPTAPHTP